MADTILMMDDDMDNIAPINEVNQPSTPPLYSAPPAGDGGTIVDPVAVQTPNQMPSFTDVVQGANAPKNASTPASANNGQASATPAQQPAAPAQAATPTKEKPKMSRKKKIIIATAAGLAGIAGIAAAASMLKKSGEEALEDTGLGGSSSGESLFGGLSGTSIQGDDLSFSQAFGNARKELGANGVFKWRGQLYGTMLKDEWDDLSDEGRDQFAHEAQSVSIDNDFPDNDIDSSDEAVAVMDAEEIDPAIEGEPVEDDYMEGELVEDDEEYIEGELVEDDEEYIEGELVEDDEEYMEGELVEDDEEYMEGELVEDDEDYMEGEAVEDDEEYIEDEYIYEEDMADGDVIEDDDYDDYMNDEDPSDFI